MLDKHSGMRGVLVKAASLAIVASNMVPTLALAGGPGWGSDDIIDPGVKDSFQPNSMMEGVQTLISAACGIAMVIFVAKVVLTAIDRFIFVGPGNNSRLDEIPLVGAYPNPEKLGPEGGSAWPWRRIWFNFAVQMLLCVSVFAITSLLFSIVNTVVIKSGVTS